MKKYSYTMITLLLFIMIGTLVMKYISNESINWNRGEEIQESFLNNGKKDSVEITDEEKLLEQKEEEQNRICEKITSECPQLDEEFVKWLYQQYEEACLAVLQAMEVRNYEDSIWYTQTGKSLFVLRDEYEGVLDSEEIMKEHLIYRKDCVDSEVISLSFAGDVCFSNDYAPSQNYTNKGIDGAFSLELQNTMQQADIFMINNEFCYSTRGTPIPKGYNFRADPARVKRLDEMGVDIVSIANNHAYDYGADAFIDTLNTLQEDDMPYVGGGSDLEDAKNHIVYFLVNGMKIGYIAASQVERDLPIFTQPATEDSPGVVRCFEPELVNEMIWEAKKNCDFVIVYPHWGTELVKEIQSDQQQLAYSFIDAGADVVIGGHPHCLQGVEYYKGIPIFYSLSNFSFSGKVVDSAVLNLEVTIEGIRQAKYIPCMEKYGYTAQCEEGDTDYKRIIDLLNRISANAQVDDKGIVTEK